MAYPKAADVARIALEWAAVEPPIPYVFGGDTRKGADCRGLVLGCVRETGGKTEYAGSNAMYRASGKTGKAWPITEPANLVPGALLYEVRQDGKEGEQYKTDGLGNAAHVMIYVGVSDNVWSVDASESRGNIGTRSKANSMAFITHYGYLPEIDYAPVVTPSVSCLDPGGLTTPPESPYEVTITASSLNCRRTPSTSGFKLGSFPNGATIGIEETQSGGGKIWGRTKIRGSDGSMLTGWVDLGYTERVVPVTPTVETAPPALPMESEPPEAVAKLDPLQIMESLSKNTIDIYKAQ
jgi:hypothetical protein